MKQKLVRVMLCLAAVLMVGTVQAKKVHTIGDSTMADYDPSSTDKRGWCQMLQQFFDGITVNNRGKSGASSKSFYKESAYWPTMVQGSGAIQSGDFVIIQFAHNDEKSNGTDGDEENAYYASIGSTNTVDYRGTTPFDTYKQYLRHFIDETKKLGGKPILVGPICRKYFSGNTIRRNGRHDLGDSFSKLTASGVTTGNKVSASDHTMDYPYQMQQVALEYDDVPYIDLTTATADLYLSYGEAYCTSNLFCNGDNTHPQGMGATLIARTFAQLVKNQAEGGETDAKRLAVLQELAQYVQISSDITFSPSSGDLGKAYSGQQIVKEYNISGFGLTPAAGTFTISTDGSFYVSTDKQNFSQSVTVDYSGSTLITSVYVKTTITTGGTVQGTLTASNGTASQTLELTAEGVDLSGGEATTCVWPLNTNDGSGTSSVLSAADVKVVGMTSIMGTVQPTSPEGHGKMAYFNIEGSTWPAGEIDENSTRYIQFQATVPSEMTVDVANISFDVCGWGGNTVSYHAYYATKSDFSDQVLIGEAVKMTNKTATTVSYDLAKTLEEGESLYIRIYPWLNGLSSTATGKYIALSDVTVSGMAKKAGGVNLSGTITFKLDQGGLDQDAVLDPVEMKAGIAATKWTAGASLTVSGTTTYVGKNDEKTVMTKIYNDTGASFASSAVDDNTLTLTLTPEDGFYFMPSKVSFNGARFGTDGGKLTVVVEAGSNSQELCSSAEVNRSGKTLDIAAFSYGVTSLMASNAEPLLLKFSFIGLGKTKTMGLSDLVIEGQLTGSASTATKYALNTVVEPSEAGTIEKDPDLPTYKEGTQVTLKAIRNFGYKFTGWHDASGAVVSTDAETTITMDGEKTMKAVFEAVPVYTVTTKVTNDADRSLGSIVLTPDDHQGRYEAGTQVTAVAQESKILKFMQWTDENENAGTSATRQLTVNSDMELVANYEVQDFVAVFDASKVQSYAYSTTAAYPFAADVTWDEQRNATASVVKVADGSLAYTQDGGTPVVRNRESVVLSSINGLYQNGYNTTDVAFQYQFSTAGFTSIIFEGDMAAKNMASKNWKALYSTDGTNFSQIEGAQWEMTANVAKALSIQLPAEANGQEMVYVRIVGDGDEMLSSSYQFDKTFDGLSYTSHSESGVGNLYILGTADVEEDGEAPVVTSTLPANNDAGISATGRITISYNERIQAAETEAQATLNGEALQPQWSSRSVSFDYFNLEYGKDYTFQLPEGFVQDRSGNKASALTLTFTVMERQQPAARTFDAIVDGSLETDVAATDLMPAQYRKIQDAIDAAPANSTRPWLIFIKEGYYNDPNTSFASSYGTRYTNPSDANDNTTERIAGGQSEYNDCRLVYVNKPNIHLIGQATDKVFIAGDRLDGASSDRTRPWYHINAGATLEIQAAAKDFYLENVTVDNENWTKKGMAGPQALAMNISADRAVFNNCNVRSYQDTYYSGGVYNRQFWYNTTIEGSVDFIYGEGDVFFENCKLNINREKGGYIVAPSHTADTRWGYVFNNTTITTAYASDPSTYQVYFGRPWHNEPVTVFLHTQCEVGTYDGYWYETMGGLPKLWAVYDIWDKNGNKMSEVSRSEYWKYNDDKTEKITATAKNSLTDEEAAQYTIANVFAGDKTSNAETGVWNPLPIVEKTAAPQPTAVDGGATWEAVPYAICYVVTVNGKVVDFPTATQIKGLKVDDVVTVQAVNEYGALSAPSPAVVVNEASGIETLHSAADMTVPEALFTVDGKRIGHMQHGLIILRKSDGSVVKVLK